MTTLIPAYGRDYRSKGEVLADWSSGKDFQIADAFDQNDGRYANRDDFPEGSGHMIRYGKLRKICAVVASVLLCLALSGCALSSSFAVSGDYAGQRYAATIYAK